MRILILSCNTGEGHNSTARAIREQAEKNGDTVDIINALSYWPSGTEKFLCEGQVFLYKNLPELFGAGYRFFETVAEKTNEKREAGKKQGQGLSLLVRGPAEKLYEELSEGSYDAIISVHVFASLMLSEIRRRHGREQPVYFIATDYTCSPGAGFADYDYAIIPAPELVEEFVSLGARRETLLPFGIPVNENFYHRTDKQKAKESLGLPADRRVVLLMSGSMGCGPIEKTVEAMLDMLPDDSVLAAVCGRNERLLVRLQKLAQKNRKLYPIGFTREIATYMDAAELIVTKAGGLSSTEAAVKHLPIVFIDAIPGLESHNRDFFEENGYAICGNSPEDIAGIIAELMNDPQRLATMRRKMERAFSHHSAREICDHVRSMVMTSCDTDIVRENDSI